MSEPTSVPARIRVSLSTGEVEIEGSEEFISQYAESIDQVLERLKTDGPVAPPPQQAAAPMGVAAPAQAAPAGAPANEEPFGEVLHSLSSKSGTDQILLAGYYVAKSAPDGTFSTTDAHSRLMEQGVKLSNASQSMKNNLNAKRVFKVGSRFKVSKTGVDHLNSLGVSAS
jgi:hypothetical protein